jgi:hypothetical protein
VPGPKKGHKPKWGNDENLFRRDENVIKAQLSSKNLGDTNLTSSSFSTVALATSAPAGAEILGGLDDSMATIVASTSSSTAASDAFSGSGAKAYAVSLGCSKPRAEDGLCTENSKESCYLQP